MDLKHILVAVNSLNGRDAAFDRALALAQSSGADLYVLHAVPRESFVFLSWGERLERMAEMRRRAEEAGVRVQTVEQHGDPAQIIRLHADTRAVDLIVMGAKPAVVGAAGRSSPRGSFAARTFRRSWLPATFLTRRTAFRNVLVAVDLSPDSEDVLRAVPRPDGAPGGVAHSDEYSQGSRSGRGCSECGPVEGPGIPRASSRGRAATPASIVSTAPASVHTRVHVSAGSRSPRNCRTRRRHGCRPRRRGTQSRLQAAWLNGPARVRKTTERCWSFRAPSIVRLRSNGHSPPENNRTQRKDLEA